MKIVRYISICLLFTFIGSLLPTKAQDNPYKIDHSLYLLYEEATKHRNNATGLEIADTIYTKAIRINDKKAQCLALTIPVIYYFNNGKRNYWRKQSAGFRRYPERTTTCNITTLAASTKLIT